MLIFQVTLSNGIVFYTNDDGRTAIITASKQQGAFAQVKCSKRFSKGADAAFTDAVEVSPSQVVSIQSVSGGTMRWATLAEMPQTP